MSEVLNKAGVENQSIHLGVGLNQGEINTSTLVGNVSAAREKTLTETAAEIQQLLWQLEQSNFTETTVGQMEVAKQTIEIVENNPDLKQRVVGALTSAGTEAFKKALDHPVAHILVAGFEGWMKP